MASINEHKSASVHGNFCPRRLSWKAPCTCNAEHNPGCAAVAVDFNDLGTCDCGVDAPCDVSKYGGVPPMGAFVSQGVKEAWSTGELPTPSHRDIVTDMIVTDEMVDRFLSWRLPDDFMPDCGVSFVKPNHPTSWPVGTNLLTATQARQMLEHVLGMTPVEPDGPRWKSVCDDPGDARDDSPFPYRNGRMVSMDGDSWIDERLLVGEVIPSRREAEVRNRQDEDEILYGNPEAAEPQGVIYADDQLREDGFYWVLPHQADEWEPASWSEDDGWMLLGMDCESDIPAIVEVGERIIAPVRGNHA